uniref:Uncharacterized protein n=1 Tax=Rhizophora mucronata TaxID=61149 RepID=A0A2P2KW64_RHIMU
MCTNQNRFWCPKVQTFRFDYVAIL